MAVSPLTELACRAPRIPGRGFDRRKQHCLSTTHLHGGAIRCLALRAHPVQLAAAGNSGSFAPTCDDQLNANILASPQMNMSPKPASRLPDLRPHCLPLRDEQGRGIGVPKSNAVSSGDRH